MIAELSAQQAISPDAYDTNSGARDHAVYRCWGQIGLMMEERNLTLTGVTAGWSKEPLPSRGPHPWWVYRVEALAVPE